MPTSPTAMTSEHHEIGEGLTLGAAPATRAAAPTPAQTNPSATASPDTAGSPQHDLARRLRDRLAELPPRALAPTVTGRVVDAIGTLLRVSGVDVSVGELCLLRGPSLRLPRYAEVVGLARDQALLMPLGPLQGISAGTQVIPMGHGISVRVGDHLLGRVIDAMGQPLDGYPLPADGEARTLHGEAPNPMTRKRIEQPMALGIRVVDALLTCGRGQRLGIFAAAGCGKSVLLGMMARNAASDINVIALIGERGREVREFIEDTLGPEGLARSVVVTATSDRPSAERVKAVFMATTIAEHFREQGRDVLLLVDSLTRYARAQREIGLAAGEPPTRRAYPPSVFSELPQIVERAGSSANGSITAFYTVLQEDDEGTDPIAEEVRGLLDGHIILSRKLANEGHFPAIDVLGSVSRVMPMITSPEHQQAARQLRELMARYRDIELLLRVGEYRAGSDPVADMAVQRQPQIKAFLQQGMHESVPPQDTLNMLASLSRMG